MKLGDRHLIESAPMVVAWRRAAADLGVRFVSPYCMEHEGETYWCSGWLPDFGGPQGAVIADRHCSDEIFDVADALGFYASGLDPESYEAYDRELFVETLDDWGWFGPLPDAPAWFTGFVGQHGGGE